MKSMFRGSPPVGMTRLCGALTAVVLALVPSVIHAASFTPGNLAVIQAEASANNTTASVIEINTTAAGQSAIQTLVIDGTTNRFSGSATSTLYLSRSADGTLIALTGHNNANTAVNANTLNPREVITFDSAGTFKQQTTYTGTSGNQTRSATSLDNTNWFIADQGGLYSNGSTAANPSGNFRGIKTFGGTVHVLTASASFPPVGTLAALTGSTFTGLPGLANGASSRQDFYLVASGSNGATNDILYILDATSNTAGTIFKYSLVSGTWTASASYTTTFGGLGLCATKSGAGADLYITTGQGALTANSVIKLTDTAGHNAAISITTANNVTLFTAATGKILKGIDFAPAALPAPAPNLVITEIQSNQAASGKNDYWELTNLGDAPVDLSNWKWDDESRNPDDAAAVAIPAGTIIAPGESIIFTALSASTFRSWWGISSSVQVISTGSAPGLGGDDIVALFDTNKTEIVFLSYKAGGFTQSSGSPSVGGHAGISGGGTATTALVLDPVFGTEPATRRYKAAVVGTAGAFASAENASDIGSPGVTGLGGSTPLIELTVSVSPEAFSESAVNPAATGTVTRSGSTTADLVVALSSSDITEATVPATVTILAGQASANFNVTAVDDSFPDGNKSSTITASATGATPGNFVVTVQDDTDVAVVKVMLTEVLSNQSGNAPAGANDYWELTNFGTNTVDLTGYTWSDNTHNYAAATAWALPSGSFIAPGESVIFTATSPAVFRAWWNLPATVQVFQSVGAPGLGGNDGVSFFDNAGNELFFFSYAASGFTRADGSPSTGGHAGPSGGASADSVALVWVPSSGTTSPRYTFATGLNHGSSTAVGPATDVGSPATTYAGPKSIDLSTYVRIGRYDLPEPTRTTPPDGISLLAQEASGVAYNWDTDTLFITADGGTSIVQISKTGVLINSMTLATGSSSQGTEFYDPEGITYVGNGQFVISEERDRKLVLFTYVPNTILTRAATKTVTIGTFVPNTGTEGLSYDLLTGGFICLKEIDPLGIFHTFIDFDAGTASNGSPTTTNSTNLFDPALTGMIDVADVFALSNIPSLAGRADYDRMLLLSHESAKIVNIDRQGNIYSTLTIVSDPGNPLDVVAQQHEGLTMDRDGILYVVSENGGGDFDHPQLWVYAPATGPNQAPTAVGLNNRTDSIVENTATTTAIKVADIVVTDDGLGANTLSLGGTDAAFFEILGTALRIKTGTVLDFETKASYSITVNVDDTTVGATPDVSVNYTLTITDVAVETPAVSTLIITEAAPWSSGNSPLAADWFEVTNPGTNAVDITGWNVDDGSASFASALVLNGITSIAAGESVIFIETANLTAARTAFLNLWFGTNHPAGLQIGSYTGSGIGLSTDGDAVNLYDSTGTLKASISFGASPTGKYPTFDNAAGLDGAPVSNLSVVDRFEAFVAVNDANEIGSPGTAGRLIVSEVAPWSSGDSTVGADWFEISNTGARPVNIAGWKVDDSSESPAAALALNGITSIAPGESVIFIEGADLNAAKTAFLANWFGTNPPASLQIGNYTGSAIGLSTGGDAVVLYDNNNRQRAKVTFGTSPAGPFATFDNAIGLNATAITQMSIVGRYGAFVAANASDEIGSPGNTGRLIVSEVAAWSSGNSPVGSDWFEISNTGARTVNIAGWKVDDSSASFASALALNGITNIAPGESVIFLESDNLATIKTSFLNTWFGGVANAPAGLQIGNYTGSGIGLSTGGDSVILFDSTGTVQARVNFDASPGAAPYATFDNAAALNGVTISQLSVVGRYGAFTAAGDINEIGSPGTTTTVPVIAITSPVHNSLVHIPVAVLAQATASKFGGTIDRVEYYLDGILQGTILYAPYEMHITLTNSGARILSAVAVDNVGLRATNRVTIQANGLPTITIVNPTQVVHTAPANILIEASVTDADGTITNVAFYAGNVLLGTDTAAPYQFDWQNVPAGSYFLTARAQDNAGGVMTSTAKHVLVGPMGMTSPTKTESGAFRFTFVGDIIGKTLRLEVSTDLINWDLVRTITPISNSEEVEISAGDTEGSSGKFYRIIEQAP